MTAAADAIVNGELLGPARPDEPLELQSEACVVGHVRYGSLEMHPGDGICQELQGLKASEKPALKLAASNAG